MYMPDLLRGTIDLMEAPAAALTQRTYNIAGMSFTPAQLAESIQRKMPGFRIKYSPDFRQLIAGDWPKREKKDGRVKEMGGNRRMGGNGRPECQGGGGGSRGTRPTHHPEPCSFHATQLHTSCTTIVLEVHTHASTRTQTLATTPLHTELQHEPAQAYTDSSTGVHSFLVQGWKGCGQVATRVTSSPARACSGGRRSHPSPPSPDSLHPTPSPSRHPTPTLLSTLQTTPIPPPHSLNKSQPQE